MELIKVGEKTYYIKNHTNIGVYKVDDVNVYTGNDKDAGRKILKIIEEEGFKVKGIINTHSNADHIGGNKIIQDRTGCPIFGFGIEKAITQYPIIEPSFLYGGYPFKELQNKFLLAKESKVIPIENNIPDGLEYFHLRGHFFDMIGIRTSDDIYFLGDSLFSEETILKYPFFFIYNIQEYLNTLDYLDTLNGKLYIPSHVEVTDNIKNLIKLNRKVIEDNLDKVYNICDKQVTFEDILKKIFDDYQININPNQYVLVGSTIRSYLSYLCDIGKITYLFKENKMYWVKI